MNCVCVHFAVHSSTQYRTLADFLQLFVQYAESYENVIALTLFFQRHIPSLSFIFRSVHTAVAPFIEPMTIFQYIKETLPIFWK